MTDRWEEVSIWLKQGRPNGSPDLTVTLPVNKGNWHTSDNDAYRLSDDVRNSGYYTFDMDVDEPTTLYIHTDDSYHNCNPLRREPVNCGVVFDPEANTTHFSARLDGVIELYLAER